MKAMELVISDMSDDWFADPLRFEDLLEGIAESSYGTVGDSQPHYLHSSKDSKSVRLSLGEEVVERVFYTEVVWKIISESEKLLGDRSYGYRYSPERYPKSLFFPIVDGYWKFSSDIRLELKSNSSSCLLCLDIMQYFDSIILTKIEELLQDVFKKVDVDKRRFFELLKKWSPNGVTGIPQNREPSSHLGNIYLAPIDKKFSEKFPVLKYFRYMDDIRVVCRDLFEANQVLLFLTYELKKIGLSINPTKTQIIRASDIVELQNVLPEKNPDLESLKIAANDPNPMNFTEVVRRAEKIIIEELQKGADKACKKNINVALNCYSKVLLRDAKPQKTDEIIQLIATSFYLMHGAALSFAKLVFLLRPTPSQAKVFADILVEPSNMKEEIFNPSALFYLWQVNAIFNTKDSRVIEKARRVCSDSYQSDAQKCGAAIFFDSAGWTGSLMSESFLGNSPFSTRILQLTKRNSSCSTIVSEGSYLAILQKLSETYKYSDEKLAILSLRSLVKEEGNDDPYCY